LKRILKQIAAYYIIRNSVYRVYTETFKEKTQCGICYLLDDTTKLTPRMGIKKWQTVRYLEEYEEKAIYYLPKITTKYCVVNPKMFPYHTN